MGLAKLGLNLAHKTSVWVKAAGKTSALQTKPLSSVKKLEGLNLASIKQDIAVFSNKIKAVEPYKSLLVRECDKPVNAIYFKNYLSEKEIRQLERAVTGYFDYIEDLIERENTFTMEEFSASINEFLNFRKYKILSDKGSISMDEAKDKAEQEYNIFNKHQKINSDFDKFSKKILEQSKNN